MLSRACPQPAPLPQLCFGAAGPPGLSLQNKIRNILLQSRVKDMPEMIIRTASFRPRTVKPGSHFLFVSSLDERGLDLRGVEVMPVGRFSLHWQDTARKLI